MPDTTPSTLALLRQVTVAADRLIDRWSEADEGSRLDLWRGLSSATDAVYGLVYPLPGDDIETPHHEDDPPLDLNGFPTSHDPFMLGVLTHEAIETCNGAPAQYLAALSWVLDNWRGEDDPERERLTLVAEGLAAELNVVDSGPVLTDHAYEPDEWGHNCATCVERGDHINKCSPTTHPSATDVL